MLLNTSSYSARSWLVSISIFLPLLCSAPWVAQLVVDLCPSQSLPLWFAQHLEVDLLIVDLSRQSRQFVSTFRALWNLDSLCLLFSCLWRVSKYSYFRRTGSCNVMFHSPKHLSIPRFSHRFELGFCLVAFCTFVSAYLIRLPSKLDARLDSLAFRVIRD